MFLLRLIWAVVHALFAKRADLVAENLALRQQLIVLHRKTKRVVFRYWIVPNSRGFSVVIVEQPTESLPPD